MRCSSDAQETIGRRTGSAGAGAASAAVSATGRAGGTAGAAAGLTGFGAGMVALTAFAAAGCDGVAAAAVAAGRDAVGAGARTAVRLASMARVAAAIEAGVGWRRIGARGASVAESVTTLRSPPTPAAMSGIRNAGNGRIGTADARGPTDAGRGRACAGCARFG